MVKTLDEITLPHNFTQDNTNGDVINFTGMDLDDNFEACKEEILRVNALLDEAIETSMSDKIIAVSLVRDDVDDNTYTIKSPFFNQLNTSVSLKDGLTIQIRLTITHEFQYKAKPKLRLDGNEYLPIYYHNQTTILHNETNTYFELDGNSFSSGLNTFTYNESLNAWLWRGCYPSGTVIPMACKGESLQNLCGFIRVAYPLIDIPQDYVDEHPYFHTWYERLVVSGINGGYGGLSTVLADNTHAGHTVSSRSKGSGVDYSFFKAQFNGTDVNQPDVTSQSGGFLGIGKTMIGSYPVIDVNLTNANDSKVTYTPPTTLKQSVGKDVPTEKFITKRFGVEYFLKT